MHKTKKRNNTFRDSKTIPVIKSTVLKKMHWLFEKEVRVFVFLFVCAFIVYANVLRGPMFFDDEHFIQKNRFVHSLDIKKIYTSSVTEGASLPGNFYRPNQQMTYALLYQIAGEKSWAYHLTSILFHIINAFFVFLLIRKLKFSSFAALMASLFFLLHPIQTQAVGYISGFADPLSLFFLLSGLLAMLNSFEQPKILNNLFFKLIAVFLFVGALFTKENMVVLFPLSILLIMTYSCVFKKSMPLSTWAYVVFLGIIAAVYMMLKFTVFNFSEHIGLTGESNIYTEYLHIRLLTFISILWDYFSLILVPINLSYEKPYTAYTLFFTWRAIFGMLLIFAMLYVLVKYKKYPYLFLGMGWFFAALVPFSGIIPLNAMYLEHWLYTPMVGVSILIAVLSDKFKNQQHKLIYLFIPLFVLYSIRTIARNEDWANVEKFYLKELQFSGNALRIYNNLGMYYSDEARKHIDNGQKFIRMNRKAEGYYRKAISLSNNLPQMHHNIGILYLSEGRMDDAFNEFLNALSIEPNFLYSIRKLIEIYELNEMHAHSQSLQALHDKVERGERISFNEILLIVSNIN